MADNTNPMQTTPNPAWITESHAEVARLKAIDAAMQAQTMASNKPVTPAEAARQYAASQAEAAAKAAAQMSAQRAAAAKSAGKPMQWKVTPAPRGKKG